jgi:type VI secretion system protein ImpJ
MEIHWHEGLFLQPHHLQLLQRHLLEQVRRSRAVTLTDGWGVLESRLSHDDLADGRVRFDRLRAILPSGQEVLHPDEARLQPLDLKSEMARGSGPWDVHLVVPLWSATQANAFEMGSAGRADSRVKLLFLPEESPGVRDENSGTNPIPVYRRRINARLALGNDEDVTSLDAPVERMRLARVTMATGEETGRLRLDPEVAPPCLRVGASAALHERMRELCAQLNASREQLRVKLATGGLPLEVKWELQMRLAVLNRFCGSLPARLEGGSVAPRELYALLRELLGELLALHPGENLFDCASYDHKDPLPALREIDRKIRGEIRVAREAEPLRVEFEGAPGAMRAGLDPAQLARATGYWLGVKTRADRTKLVVFLTNPNKFVLIPESMKLAAPIGLELAEETQPPLDLPGQTHLYYFRLLQDASPRAKQRWEQMVKEKAILARWNPNEFDLRDAKLALYMTVASSE